MTTTATYFLTAVKEQQSTLTHLIANMAEDERNDSTLEQLMQYLGIDRVEYGDAVSAMAMSAYESHTKKGDFASIDEAVRLARLSLYCTSEGHASRAARLNNLGLMLESRYEWAGKEADLEAAIAAAKEAVSSCPKDHHNRILCLNNLGNKLQSRYELTREIADLDAAIAAAQKVIRENHPDRERRLSNLGNQLESRYEMTREMDDLKEAIVADQQGIG